MIARKQTYNEGLGDALANLATYTESGRVLANDCVSLLDGTVREAAAELQRNIDRLERGDYRDQEVTRSLAGQLSTIRDNYELLPQRMENEVAALTGGSFAITLFGRTTAGKSTLMTVLTHGDGSQIGNGSQRTTRDVRTYEYHGLEVTDVPGIAAFGGTEDEVLAFETAKQGDLILFLITDDAPQRSEAKFLSRIKSLGKPIICLVNVKVGVNATGHMDEGDFEDLHDDLQEKFEDIGGLQAIRRSLVGYGPEFGQDWSHIPFAYVHLKSAHLSQLPEYEPWKDDLYRLSRFDDAIELIECEVRSKGGFYRLKSYVDVVSVPLVDALEVLFAQSIENSSQGRMLIQKKRKHDTWIEDFKKRASTRIDTLLTTIRSDLKREASSFAEDNYGNKNVSRDWATVVEWRNIQDRANALLLELQHECEDELRDIGREIDFDMKFARYKLGNSRVRARAVVDTKRVWNWTTVAISAGLTIAGLFVAPQLIAGGVVAGLVGAIGGLFIDDFEERKKRARVDLQKQLDASIDRSISQLSRQMNSIVSEKIIENQLRPTSRRISDVVSSLFELSATQRKLARRINEQQRQLSGSIVDEALSYLGYVGLNDAILRVARIPGEAITLILADQSKLPYSLRRDLGNLLGEGVRYVFEADDKRVMLSRTIGRSCDRRNIRIEYVKGEPLIAHIKMIDELGSEARLGMRLGTQVTELLIAQ